MLKIICNNGHTNTTDNIRCCPVKDCNANEIWIIDPSFHSFEKFCVIVKLDENEKKSYGVSAWDIDHALSLLKNELKTRNSSYSVKVSPIEESTTLLTGRYIIAATPKFKIDEEINCEDEEIHIKHEYIGHSSLLQYNASIIKMEFKSANAIPNSKYNRLLRKFKQLMRTKLENNPDCLKIIHTLIEKHQDIPQSMLTGDAYTDFAEFD